MGKIYLVYYIYNENPINLDEFSYVNFILVRYSGEGQSEDFQRSKRLQKAYYKCYHLFEAYEFVLVFLRYLKVFIRRASTS